MRIKVNPVLMRELKVKMRGWKAAAVIFIYLLMIAAVGGFILWGMARDPYSSSLNPSRAMSIYAYLAVMQFVLIMFIAPASTAGSISGEREKQTLDLLLSTKLPARSVVLGKLFASISHIILLIAASLPIFSIVFLFGGIGITEVLELFGYYVATAITLGAIGIFFSTFFKKTSLANVFAYGTIGFLAIGTVVIAAMYASYYTQTYRKGYEGIPFFIYANPLAGFGSMLGEQFGMGRGYGGVYIPILGDLMNIGMRPSNPNAPQPMAIWKGNLIFNGVLTVLLLVLSSYKIKPVKRGMFKFAKGIFSRMKLRKKPAVNQ